MKILLVYPKVTETFWSFKHTLKIVRRTSAFPPLGALTVAALLPASWEKRLVDMNVRQLRDEDLLWADYVFVSAMIAQRDSSHEVFARCRKLGAKTVAGGPLFKSFPDDYSEVDVLVLGEGEVLISRLSKDLEAGRPARRYESEEHPGLEATPVPLWDLINLSDYVSMSVQYSRGCPFNCEFCDIIVMNGRVPRSKSNEQMLREIEALYERGWRSSVFIVDDNFIGNKSKVKGLLRALISWQERRGYPVSFFTEASVDLAEDQELMDLMVRAGFSKVFLGLETPSEESLRECGKSQNLKRGLSDSVRAIQESGLIVMGGFIIGFDSDPHDIFQRQVDFIQKNGIMTAMIGLLTALPATRLYLRLQEEGRLLFQAGGDNTDVAGTLNFVTKMDRETIISGYRWVMNTIYSPEMFHGRLREFLRQYKPRGRHSVNAGDFATFVRTIWYLGFADGDGKSRLYYWDMLRETLASSRKAFADTVTMLVFGYHFRQLFWDPAHPLRIEDCPGA